MQNPVTKHRQALSGVQLSSGISQPRLRLGYMDDDNDRGGEIKGLVFKTVHYQGLSCSKLNILGQPVPQLVVQHDIQQRGVNLHIAVVLDEAQFAEFIQKSAHARPRGADHLCKRCLIYFRNDRFWSSLFAEICHERQRSREALLARIE